MNTLLKGRLVSLGLIASITLYPQIAYAESITNKDFLQFTNDQKKHWLFSAIDTLGFVATYRDKKIGKCVLNWYAFDTAAKNGLIEAHMAKNPDRMPSAILIGLTENACGSYVRIKKSVKN